MSRIVQRSDSGFTILETTITLALFVVGLSVLFSTMNTAVTHADGSLARIKATATENAVASRLAAILSESSIEHIDTTCRVTDSLAGFTFETDRFGMMGMHQCASATCGFHTNANLAVDAEHVHCSREYRTGAGVNSVTRGKIWPSELDTCPLDGSFLNQWAMLDGVKMLAARSGGEFATINNRPHWNTMLFIFPRLNSENLCDLVVTELRIQDLIDSGVAESNWTRWTNNEVSFVELLDFGQDGTTNGIPDGSAPVTAAGCDAEFEVFSMFTTADGQNLVIFSKTLGSTATAMYRRIEVEINVDTGRIGFNFHHRDAIGTSWQSDGVIDRAPEVLTKRLSEFSVSTQASTPFDAVNNPLGVDNQAVRVHVGTTARKLISGTRGYEHEVATLRVRPRN